MCKHHIMGSSLAGDLYSTLLSITDNAYAALGGNVTNVYSCSAGIGKSDLSCGNTVLGSPVHALYAKLFGYLALVHDAAVYYRQIFAVGSNKQSAFLALFKSFSHKFGILHRSAVIGYHLYACLCILVLVGKLFAIHALCYGTHRIYLNACRRCLIHNVTGSLNAVAHRLCVGHTAHCRKSACRRSSTACDNIFLISLSGIPEMNMDIAQGGKRCKTCAVVNKVCITVKICTYICNICSVNKDIRLIAVIFAVNRNVFIQCFHSPIPFIVLSCSRIITLSQPSASLTMTLTVSSLEVGTFFPT